MFNLKKTGLKKNILLVIVFLCIIALGAEISLIFENGLKEAEEVLFSLLLIGFWLLLIMYLFNNIYLNNVLRRNERQEHKNLTDF